ncbi:hypothetical protein T492DRAFT_837095 [Pavlovales sp. CCMP2436]|nr:hypothetical protein T492DRAFT_837095 [Pavlovales sp. CCMP2436]
MGQPVDLLTNYRTRNPPPPHFYGQVVAFHAHQESERQAKELRGELVGGSRGEGSIGSGQPGEGKRGGRGQGGNGGLPPRPHTSDPRSTYKQYVHWHSKGDLRDQAELDNLSGALAPQRKGRGVGEASGLGGRQSRYTPGESGYNELAAVLAVRQNNFHLLIGAGWSGEIWLWPDSPESIQLGENTENAYDLYRLICHLGVEPIRSIKDVPNDVQSLAFLPPASVAAGVADGTGDLHSCTLVLI